MNSGQIIATSHDLGPQKIAFRKGIPLISGKSRLVNEIIIYSFYILARLLFCGTFFFGSGGLIHSEPRYSAQDKRTAYIRRWHVVLKYLF